MAERIVRLASKGDGQTEDGRFVAYTAPGDIVRGDEIERGPHYRTPPCPHFGSCGGCQLQHVDDETLAEFVTRRVVDTLAGQGVVAGEVLPAHLSPPDARRRVSLGAERKGKAVFIGFNEAKSNRLIDIRSCPVMDDRLFALVGPLKAFARDHLPQRTRWTIKLALVDQGIDCLIEGWDIEGYEPNTSLTDFAEEQGLARLSVDGGYGAEARWEPEPVTVTFGGVPVPYPHFAFLQPTPDGEAMLTEAVMDIVGDARFVADLFAGLGTFTLPLTERAERRVYAAEGARDAMLALKQSADRAQRKVLAEHRDLFRRPLQAKELARFHAVVLDPPRAGAKEQVVQLAESAVPTIAYVSCNPSSFARDAATLLAGGYRLERLWPVGQFRWSTHVELVGEFRRFSS